MTNGTEVAMNQCELNSEIICFTAMHQFRSGKPASQNLINSGMLIYKICVKTVHGRHHGSSPR